MTYKQYTNKLKKAGFLTTEKSNIIKPVELSGEYEAENGFIYDITWGSEMLTKTSKEGRKPELLQAERECGYYDLDEYSTEEEYQSCYNKILTELGIK